MGSPTDLSADGRFLLFFQQDIPPMLLRAPLARPAAQPYDYLPPFQHFLGHPHFVDRTIYSLDGKEGFR
jgi:hypothetical protein